MRIVVNDTSCLIDLKKAGILDAMLLLPFEFKIPVTVFKSELRDLSPAEVIQLQKQGLQTVDQPPSQVERAMKLRSNRPTLSFNDCLCLALAETLENAIVLTGDRRLRDEALKLSLETHGVLWICDHLALANVCSYEAIHRGLTTLLRDSLVYLPRDELEKRIRDLAALL